MNEVIDRRSTDQIIAEVCASLNVERVEIRRPTADAQSAQQIVRTAPFTYYGNDRLDVSPGSADPVGGWFAPSKEIAESMQCAQSAGVPVLVDVAFNWFANEYVAEMRASFGIVPGSGHWETLDEPSQFGIHAALSRGVEPTPTAWDALFAMREVTLVCTCTDSTRCHRVLLARILEKLGARYAGEV